MPGQRLTFEERANISRRRILCAVATELGIPDPVTFFRSKSHHQKVLSMAQDSTNLLAEPAPVFRIFTPAYPSLGVVTVAGGKGSEGILDAISDLVLAVGRRER